MCLLLRKSEVFKLVLGIITMFILCLPEFFKIHEVSMIFHVFASPPGGNSSPILNTPTVNPREMRMLIIKDQAKGLLEVKTEDVIYSYKYFNFTTVSEKEEVEHNTYYLLEMHINNSVVGGRNAAEEHLNHSCLLAMMEDQNDCINISLQLKSYVEYPMCMAKIIWLTMIAIVFVFTISIVIYKIVQENEQNYCKHRVAAAVSTILRRKSFGYAGRTISTTKIHPFPVKTSKQQIPLTAQTTEKLPIIPEQEHCHVGASTIEVADVAV
ncbi:transmembrane protein 156 isoform X5 [Falco peregrinus]|uniref:transmembrane protein 156 isoform X5 n=1 Tax=Falco peregrinus TaxID=8954 RepID=UPI002478F620|nr:transmembrane protein 156 isoform X5 [Falco peregrinus]